MCKVVRMKRATLSMEQANVLFNRECMAVCGKDCITVNHAISILSNDAVLYALDKTKAGEWWNVFTKLGWVKYLTYKGYIQAVGYYNVEQAIMNEVLENDTGTREEHGE